jgi:hypothetical protein
MNEVVKYAVDICSWIYIAVGLFGNIASYPQDVGGISFTLKQDRHWTGFMTEAKKFLLFSMLAMFVAHTISQKLFTQV